MGRRTPLYDTHIRHGARMVDFAGWDMPLHYGSQLIEHRCVREQAGLFDVSHMTTVDVSGGGARDFLRRLLANDVARLTTPGAALYSAMLNEKGGVIDDLIVYALADDSYRLVLNCATHERVLPWITRQASGQRVTVREQTDGAIIAVQGPAALAAMQGAFGAAAAALVSLPAFSSCRIGDWLVARTGYTGEDGFEIMLPADAAEDCWRALVAQGVRPAGLAARDTLRLEAGLNLHSHEMDEDVTPLEANMAWTLVWDPETRHFIGRTALEELRQRGGYLTLAGLVMTKPGVLRAGQLVRVAGSPQIGVITSGTYSPTLGHAIALARIPDIGAREAVVDIRGRPAPVRVVRPPFVRHGKKVYN
ncbi:MAG: glycine cleavage system aminomethyltransferase GcvT [Gammaproteobacteria bacterium]|nr:glycine cleavage system aminomethyltransferase GcvT [Gammaproteobacteria bacterium]